MEENVVAVIEQPVTSRLQSGLDVAKWSALQIMAALIAHWQFRTSKTTSPSDLGGDALRWIFAFLILIASVPLAIPTIGTICVWQSTTSEMARW